MGFKELRTDQNGGKFMEKKNLDWSNIGFRYMVTDKRYVANYKDRKSVV